MAKHLITAPAASWLTLERRGKLYRIAAALGVVAIFYGILTEEALGVWLGLVASILGNTTASAYTPARKVASDA